MTMSFYTLLNKDSNGSIDEMRANIARSDFLLKIYIFINYIPLNKTSKKFRKMYYRKLKLTIWLYNIEPFEKNILMMKTIKPKGEEALFYDLRLRVKTLI